MKTFVRSRRGIGVIGLAVLAALGTVVVVLSKLSIGAQTYEALLSQTAGLRAGEAVLVAGVPSGRVETETVEGAHVRVVFTLSSDIKLGDRTTAEVKVATLLGTHDLEIHPAGAGSLGGAIPLSRTSVPYNLQDVIDKGTDQLDQLDTDKLAQALSAVTSAMRASGQDVVPALEGIDRLSRVVVSRNQDFKSVLSATRSVTDQLSGSAGDLVRLMQTSNQFLTELNLRRQVIDQLLNQVQDLATTVQQLIKDNNARLTPVLDDLDSVLTVLRQRDADIRSALHATTVTARYLSNASGNGPWLEMNTPDPEGDAIYCLRTGAC